MAESVGQIGLDLVVNQKQFNRQMSGVTSLAKKAGVALAGAFAIKKIVQFGAECTKLGSDLQEVQNVVDVTFPRMNTQVNEFAKSAAASFGLSETMAKKFTGTFGAMAKSFGFTEKASYDMATALTGLSGDVASFYNISQDEAYTKLKSVFTGETETLKDLGVVMTQNALDAYAMANGYGKVTQKMSEQEKVALRCAFVQDKLKASAGDFVRTSDSWANQTRILTLQFDSLKASIGQGLINAFTPIIKVINVVLGKLASLASTFASFMGDIFGKQDTGQQDEYNAVADAAANASESVEGIGEASKKSKKEQDKFLAGFDKITKVSSKSSDSASSGSGTGKVASTPKTGGGEKKTSAAMTALQKQFSKLKKEFLKGFTIGSGNLKQGVESCKKHLRGIGSSLKDIFTDKKVKAAFNKLVSLFAKNLGTIIGAIASIRVTIADNLLGGIDIFLKQNKERIKEWLINIFNIAGEISTIRANFMAAVAEIFEVFRSYDAKQITADIIAIFTTSFGGCIELFLKIGRDILNLITKPIIENKDKIKKALENTLKPLRIVIGSIKDAVQGTWDKIQSIYDQHIKPLFDSLATGLSDIFGKLLDGYNTYVAPVLEKLANKFKSLMEKYIRPAINKFLEFIGSVADALKKLWENVLQPVFAWIATKIMPIVANVISFVGAQVMNIFQIVSSVFGGIFETLKGVLDFFVGVFSGDIKKATEGLKGIFSGFWNAIKGVFSGVVKFFANIFKGGFNAIKGAFSKVGEYFSSVWKKIAGVFVNIGLWFGDKFKAAWRAIKQAFTNPREFFSGIWTKITGVFSSVKNWFGDKFSAAASALKKPFSAIGNWFKDIFGGIKDAAKTPINWIIGAINTLIKGLNKISFKLPDWAGGKKFGINIPRIKPLAQGGYVKANAPQLAMIGDNRHQGEVVAPEDKLAELARRGAELAGSGDNSRVIELLTKIIDLLDSLNLTIEMDGEKVTKKVVNRINSRTKSTGRCEIRLT